MQKVSLSPPPYTLYSKIQKTLGVDPYIHVQPLRVEGSTYFIDLVVGDQAKASALAKTLLPEHDLGDTTVKVSVIDVLGQVYSDDPDDTPADIAETVDDALSANPLYHSTEVSDRIPPNGVGQVIAVFAPAFIQFFNDDLSDYYCNFNGIAAHVFEDILRLDYPNSIQLSVTTEPGSR